jgi:hypothetical protein
MTKYQVFEDVLSDFAAVTERTDDSLFEEGRVIADAVDQGYDRKQVVRECAKLRGMSDRTTRNREKAYRVFEKRGKRATGVCHSLHVLCLKDTDVDDESTWDKAEQLIEMAAAGYIDPDGCWRPHTTRSFKLALEAVGESVESEEPTFLLDAVKAVVIEVKEANWNDAGLTLLIPGGLDMTLPEPGDHIVITIAKGAQPEAQVKRVTLQAPAQEAA